LRKEVAFQGQVLRDHARGGGAPLQPPKWPPSATLSPPSTVFNHASTPPVLATIDLRELKFGKDDLLHTIDEVFIS
jgi:hypothetical protein